MANGILSNKELVGSLLQDLNNMVKEQQAGQHLQACAIIVSMTQKLTNLYKTIDDDLKNRDETIATLKNSLREHGVEVIDIPAAEYVKALEKENGK